MTMPKTLLEILPELRDHVARALMGESHKEIADFLDVEMGDDQGCSSQIEPCGGCKTCVYAQSTWSDHTAEGFVHWQAQADDLLARVRSELEFGGVA